MVQVPSHSRQRHIVVTLMTLAKVSMMRPLQKGHAFGRVTGSSSRGSGCIPQAGSVLMLRLFKNEQSWDDRLGMAPKPPPVQTTLPPFDVEAFFKAAGVSARTARFATGTIVYAQGAQASSVFYVQEGGVKLSVLSSAGKEAVVAMLGPGDFLGEGCLAGQPLRMGTAKAVMRTALLRIPKRDMIRMLREHSEFSDRFIAHMLTRNIRIEEDLVDQLFNSSEKRLARTLLLLARYGKEDTTPRVLPKLSQETLAEMVGTTRSRVNFFMNKFRKLGLIEYNGGLKVNSSLLSIVLHD